MGGRSTSVLVLVLGLAASGGTVLAQDTDSALLSEEREIFKRLPADFGGAERPITPERVALGKALFFDPRWSIDQSVSCASCHNPALYGTDGLSRSIGVGAKRHPRNAQTVLNMAGDPAVSSWNSLMASAETPSNTLRTSP